MLCKEINKSNQPIGSNKFRKNRFRLFLEIFKPDSKCSILDVGGTSEIWCGSGLESNVTLLNLTSPKSGDLEKGFELVQGDALNMAMFGENQFDIVFSNSVIEHVGDFDHQVKFAEEIRRVGRNYWIQTPNRYFPIEPHFLFPFFQFLPRRTQEWIAIRWRFSHPKRLDISEERILQEVRDIRLLTNSELKRLFWDARIYREKVLGITKSLVAYKTDRNF